MFKSLASLRITLTCLGLAMVLIFAGTLDQVNLGIHAAQKKYFESLFVFWSPSPGWNLPVFPGGFLISGVLIVNLLAAFATRFRLARGKEGILIVHSGIILMLAGMLVTSYLAVESQMALDEGSSKNYSEHTELCELAIIDVTDPKWDDVVTIPQEFILKKGLIQHPKLPFTVQILESWPHSALSMRKADAPPSDLRATQGIGANIQVEPLPVTGRPNEVNLVTAYVELKGPQQSLGVWLLSEGLGRPEPFEFEGRKYTMRIRAKRYYKPYTVQLIDFKHDIYPGTDIPKNFSSQVRILDPDHHEDRNVLIYMNNPLRYRGDTYYQASFANDDRTSIFQVVRNPGWLTPYISCIMIALGMMIQFSIHLFQFIQRRKK